MKTIYISRDFSRVPAGRHKIDSDHSGEVFRDALLAPALRKYDHVKVVLDDTEGFGSSFLEEAFGGLIRYCGFTRDYLASHLSLVAESPGAMRYPARIENYIQKAATSKLSKKR